VEAFAGKHGWPVVLKGRSGGYDGRGVHVLDDLEGARRFLSDETSDPEVHWLVEEHLDLTAEFAVLLARSPSGNVAVYPPIATLQVDGICRELSIPADLPERIVASANRMAVSVIDGIDAIGICAVEFFCTRDGRLLLNELALRPHNSGHVTMEACRTSQFHQHLRAVLDWPLGSTDLISPAATVNIIAGPEAVDPLTRLPAALAVPGASIHLYQKSPRPGRKLGHVTALGSTVDEALATARSAAALLTQATFPTQPSPIEQGSEP
jgi:5-(carboxyamino)imidazole ribonucleotide synthase